MENTLKLKRSKAIKYISDAVIGNGFNNPLIAFSGGPDSCFLLACTSLIGQRKSTPKNFSVHACHVNHNLRSSAKVDEKFSIDFCKYLNIQLDIRNIHLPSLSNIYHEARLLRYGALVSSAKALGCDCILTAHHGDDLVETIIMQATRGVSKEKMGIKVISSWEGIPVIRPLFAFTKDEIQKTLAIHKIPFVVDASNISDRIRSKIRSNVLPILKSFNPNVHKTMYRIFVDDVKQ